MTPVNHRTMLLTPCAPPLYWQASILALCSSLDVWWDDGTGDGMDSPGDWLADNGFLDDDGGKTTGRAA